jgi:hypothetical protein
MIAKSDYSILEVLMIRDDMSREEAQEWIDDVRAEVAAGADPEEMLHYEFGLEPDYIFDLI